MRPTGSTAANSSTRSEHFLIFFVTAANGHYYQINLIRAALIVAFVLLIFLFLPIFMLENCLRTDGFLFSFSQNHKICIKFDCVLCKFCDFEKRKTKTHQYERSFRA